jgi:hypothetical protein
MMFIQITMRANICRRTFCWKERKAKHAAYAEWVFCVLCRWLALPSLSTQAA